ncbi:hypothetical protein [Sphingomonas sp. MM-1]|uniref:hypothetical protein n=1 Tax=Sphingomonas sp. MM-1 TaxID=745310 RepID=UPI000A674A90|nr:hypothetical protein [Sphingomonas sp. MM-1]
MRAAGIWLTIIGILGAIAALSMDVSVSTPFGRVANLSLMAAQTNFILLSGLAILVGVILLVKGKREDKADKPRTPVSNEPLPYGIIEQDGLFLWANQAFPSREEAIAHVKQRLADHAAKARNPLP